MYKGLEQTEGVKTEFSMSLQCDNFSFNQIFYLNQSITHM